MTWNCQCSKIVPKRYFCKNCVELICQICINMKCVKENCNSVLIMCSEVSFNQISDKILSTTKNQNILKPIEISLTRAQNIVKLNVIKLVNCNIKMEKNTRCHTM